jgi:flagellar protein FliT
MEKREILSVYEKVSSVMEKMAQAAQDSDWDMLIELEAHYTLYMNLLRQKDHHEDLTDEEIQFKMELIQKILDDDKTIRELTEPWMKQLSELIAHSSTSRKIDHAYQPGSLS